MCPAGILTCGCGCPNCELIRQRGKCYKLQTALDAERAEAGKLRAQLQGARDAGYALGMEVGQLRADLGTYVILQHGTSFVKYTAAGVAGLLQGRQDLADQLREAIHSAEVARGDLERALEERARWEKAFREENGRANHLAHELRETRGALAHVESALAEARDNRGDAEVEAAQIALERDRLREERDQLRRAYSNASVERDKLQEERARLEKACRLGADFKLRAERAEKRLADVCEALGM